MNWRNHPAFWAAIGVVVTIVLAVGVVLALRQTGDANAVSDNAPLIAGVIALGGVGTTQMVSIALEGRRVREARQVEDRRIQEARQVEDRRIQEARALEAQRTQESALQNYFEAVGELLTAEKSLHRASPGDNLSTVVRAQTMSVLEGLEPDRKRILLLFLYQSGLISKRKPVVNLVASDLQFANLRGASLSGADLSGVNLSRAILGGATLEDGANLSGAVLRFADLSGAELRHVNLLEADLSGAILGKADLSESSLPNANLRKAFLRGANLVGASLRYADLRTANLIEADLQLANLLEADLSEADLSGARGWTKEQLSEAGALEGATMPDGQKYEDWLKDNEGSGQDVENE